MYAGKRIHWGAFDRYGKGWSPRTVDMKNAGAFTIAQDEAGCAVFGMPKEAIDIGAVSQVETLLNIPQLIIDSL